MTESVRNSVAMARPATVAQIAPAAPRSSMHPDQLRRAASEFEAFFLARALEPMFEGIATEAPFGGGMAETMWRSLLVDEYGKAFAKSGGIGIADAMVRDLVDLQEKTPAPDTASATSATSDSPSTSLTISEMKHP